MPDIIIPPVLSKRFYPTVSSIVDMDDIPEFLDFIKDSIESVLDKLHYKDLQFNKSPFGDAAYYSLTLVSKDRIEIEIFGSGISLVLNPDLGSSADFNISAFPIEIAYQWKILSYLRDFNLSNFEFSFENIFQTVLRALNISEQQALAHFINIFIEEDGNTPLIDQFVNELNSPSNGFNILPVEEGVSRLKGIAEQIHEQSGGELSSYVAFGIYIASAPSDEEIKNKLKVYFNSFLPTDLDSYVRDLILPKARIGLKLSSGIEFPRNLLKPVYNELGLNPINEDESGESFTVIPEDNQGNPKVVLTFAEAEFYANSEVGIGYNLDLIVNTSMPAQLGNTGVIIDIHNLKVDLSEKTNIPEADLDGRSKEFKGVFISEATITLPPFLKNNSGNNPQLYANNLLIGLGTAQYFSIRNSDYRRYREEMGLGMDHHRYSDIKEFELPLVDQITFNMTFE